MNWKRALLIAGAALIVWLRPWRRLRGRPAAGLPAGPFPEVVPVAPLRQEEAEPAPAPAALAAESVPPEDAFGAAPGDDPPAELPEPVGPAEAFAPVDELAPEAAFAAPGPELIVGPELDAAADLAGAPEPDGELEAELSALGEPEPVEMAEDDLIDVGGARAVGEPAQPDDLLVIEGIGPRVSTIVTAAGIRSFAELAAADVERLRGILLDAGLKTVDPTTWPEQAGVAVEGRWDDLRELQRMIKNGRKEGA